MSILDAPRTKHAEDPCAAFPMHHLPQLVMDQIDCGLVVCDPLGRMVHANRAALRELEGGQILRVEDGAIRSCRDAAQGLQSAILDAATRGRRRMVSLGERPRMPVVVVPLPAPTTSGASLVLVMLGRRTLCTPLSLELLATQHRLTLAEQRVLRALVGGAAARQIATENGVALSTVRTQLQSIRDKLGVGNIDALLLAAALIPPVPSCH